MVEIASKRELLYRLIVAELLARRGEPGLLARRFVCAPARPSSEAPAPWTTAPDAGQREPR